MRGLLKLLKVFSTLGNTSSKTLLRYPNKSHYVVMRSLPNTPLYKYQYIEILNSQNPTNFQSNTFVITSFE